MTTFRSNFLIYFALLAAAIFAFCKSAQRASAGTSSSQPTTNMPKPSSTPGPGDYAAEWAAIDSLERQGLYKSALERTEALFNRTKADRNNPQMIKALLFRGKYTTLLEEDGFIKAVQTFENEEKNATYPAKAILQSMLGELYAIYLSNQGWRISDRTPVPGGEGGDILTWSADQIEKHAFDLYAASVSQPERLSGVSVGSFRDIVQTGSNDSVGGAPLRPSLFDLLAHRALSHFANDRSYLTEPVYKFYLEQPEAFAPAEDFVHFNFTTKDSSSGRWMAIRLYQQLLKSHLERSKSSAALIDADLLRLQFAYNTSISPDKMDLYEQALQVLHKTHFNHPSDAEIVYTLASFWVQRDNLLPKSDGAMLKRAVAECEDARRRHPDSYGAGQCLALLNDLRRQFLGVAVEQANLPEKPVLVSLTYKNLSKVWVKVVPLPNNPYEFNEIDWAERFAYLNTLTPVQQATWDLTNPGDYRQHRTEISLDALPPGRYAVVAATSAAFTWENEFICHAEFNCSNLAVSFFKERGSTVFAAVNRESGIPQTGVQADFFKRNWDYKQQKQVWELLQRTPGDQNGFVRPDISERVSFTARFSKGNDTIWLDEFFHDYRSTPPQPRRDVQFFTDRSLYRPGQTVYFKGVLLQRDEKNYPKMLPNEAVVVKFYDVNNQVKGTLNLRTNEFGTFNGAFTAPSFGLTGQMRIAVDGVSGAARFNVEEYKRPRFEVSFKPVEGAYRVNDTVTVRGEAKNYAGSSVDGAQVRYRVVRQARFPWWDWWKGYNPYSTGEMEILNGDVLTQADGSFEIKFTALPDPSIPKSDQPVFNYRIMADVTDITGETRSSQTNVSAGYIALNVDFGLAKETELDSLAHIDVNTTNTAGQFQPASGVITIQRLIEPKQLFVKRYWEDPDILTLKEAAFRRAFPNYAWNGEDNPDKWDRPDVIRTVNFNTANEKRVNLNDGRMTAGYYQITLQTKDPYGEAIDIKRIVHVWDARDRRTQFNTPDGIVEKRQYQPGETARVWLGGKGERFHFLIAEGRMDKNKEASWLELSGAAEVALPVAETDRGGIAFTAFTVKNNRFYTVGPLQIGVPWSNKDLNIQYETFRDKLLPGQPEEWRLRISGPKKEKVAAELVATLYDASLDQFLPHNWSGIWYPSLNNRINFSGSGFAANYGENRFEPVYGQQEFPGRSYDFLNWFDFPLYAGGGDVFYLREMGRTDTVVTFDPETYEEKVQIVRSDGQKPMAAPAAAMAAPAAEGMAKRKDEATRENDERPEAGDDAGGGEKPAPAPRRNLNETVFFFPALHTDADGNVVLKFTMNEALTRWKFLAFAQTKELQFALSEKAVVTQKDLMVLTNAPRFLREGDALVFTAKVSNLSQAPITGTASLKLFDATTMAPADAAFGQSGQKVPFTVQPGQSAPVSWTLKVPEGQVNGLTWQVFAEGNQFTDGEENTLPVLSNRMLVTETLPITVRGNQSKTVVFDNLKNADSKTLRSERYTVEFTSNPAWYAVQALPYIMEYPYECTEQMFGRLYANSLAASVTQKLPNLRRVYDRWKGTDAMKSNLSKNQELKTALLEETPWVLAAQSEEQQKQQIALLFDLNRMADEQERALKTLDDRQGPDGGWPWFPGGQPDWYITQYIAAGFGHLDKLGALPLQNGQQITEMRNRALNFCDNKVQEEYRKLEAAVQKGKTRWDDDHLDGLILHYLYTRSFTGFDAGNKITNYYLGQAEKYWLGKGLYQEGLLALALHRAGRKEAAQRIVASLRERATQKEELGMYWPFNWGMYWYQLPVETQALMVEVFDEAGGDAKAVEELRIWLLKNKQTNRWESTKATAEAVYALLLHGENWLNNTQPMQVSLGNKTLKPAEYEPGTGYFKETWAGSEVKSSWSTIKVDNPNSNIVWGAAYWQYFEDMDKIKSFQKTPLTIVKQLFKEENTPTGPVLTALSDGNVLHPGDKLKVRIEIRVDREMEYVHLKDMRASGFEPINVLSGYRWQDGLGYYESTKDLATHFFISYLPRGTFVFEYPMVVNHRGDFSNGITTIQCMYAPEFTSHSAGIRVKVE